MRLLLIEDDAELSHLLADRLTRRGFKIDVAHNGADGLHMAELLDYAAVTLDLGLPDMDGFDLLRILKRRRPHLPVLILTARSQVEDRVAGLESGADDYLVKPFDFDELAARLNVLVRRRGRASGQQLRIANLTLDTSGRQAEVDGEPQVLSSQELNLLELLLRRNGRVVPKRQIEDELYGFTAEVGPNALEAAVSRLRKGLQRARADVEIQTIRGIGYRLTGAPPAGAERPREVAQRAPKP